MSHLSVCSKNSQPSRIPALFSIASKLKELTILSIHKSCWPEDGLGGHPARCPERAHDQVREATRCHTRRMEWVRVAERQASPGPAAGPQSMTLDDKKAGARRHGGAIRVENRRWPVGVSQRQGRRIEETTR